MRANGLFEDNEVVKHMKCNVGAGYNFIHSAVPARMQSYTNVYTGVGVSLSLSVVIIGCTTGGSRYNSSSSKDYGPVNNKLEL